MKQSKCLENSSCTRFNRQMQALWSGTSTGNLG